MLTIVIPTIGRDWQRAVDSVRGQTVETNWMLELDIGAKRRGAGPTRNRAIKKVKTDWVGFCDDDDYLDKHYHEWLFETSPGFDVVIFKMKNSPNGAIPYTLDPNQLKYNEVGMSFALKTKIAQKFKFKNMIGEDYDLLMRLKKKGYKIKISPWVAYFIGRVN